MKPSLTVTKFAVATLAASFVVMSLILDVLLVYPALDNLLDFGSFVAAGRAVREGINPYQADLPLVFQLKTRVSDIVFSPNLNPPITLLFFEILADANPQMLVTSWRLCTLFVYGCAVLVLLRKYPFSRTAIRIIWAFSLAGFWHVLQLGQIYAPILLAVIGTWLLLEEEHPRMAGITLGLIIAIKPNFVIWALILGLAGYWSTFLIAGAVSAGISILPAIVFGSGVYSQWAEAITQYQIQAFVLPGNNSLSNILAHVGLSRYTLLIEALFICVTIYVAYRNRAQLQKLNELGVFTSVFLSPIAWTGYTILCLPIFLSKREWPWQYWVAATIFIFPYFLVFGFYDETPFSFVVFGWFYGWGLLFLLWGLFANFHNVNGIISNDNVIDNEVL